jgi:hypothetical protein
VSARGNQSSFLTSSKSIKPLRAICSPESKSGFFSDPRVSCREIFKTPGVFVKLTFKKFRVTRNYLLKLAQMSADKPKPHQSPSKGILPSLDMQAETKLTLENQNEMYTSKNKYLVFTKSGVGLRI